MKPVIFGCEGPVLTDQERFFFSKEKPLGFILFARNIVDRKQVAALTADLKRTIGRHKVPILIDQEGGRVQRLTEPHWRKYPPMAAFGEMALKDPTLAASALRLNCKLIADDLRKVGINVNCAPLIDVPQPNGDDVIGDRAFAPDPGLVSALGRIASDAFQEAGVLPVIKHLPGHGRATADSHHELPVVEASLEELESKDFIPFQALKDAPFGMTAHILYSAIDPVNPATLSKLVIARAIRMKIGFKGLLMTDDMSMKALDGELGDLAVRSLEAGCDIILHCNGIMREMKQIAAPLKMDTGTLENRIATLVRRIERVPMADRADLKLRYDELMAKF
ncbi:MAG: beta-N-acetylhexosaminidase [Kordiimonadaceae bacterium]|nr:beta-N-acetylhexosaminidase [Kordiimonadaceae bacterium]